MHIRTHTFGTVTTSHAHHEAAQPRPPAPCTQGPGHPQEVGCGAPTLGLRGGRLLGARDTLPAQLPADPCLAVKPVREQRGFSAAWGQEPAHAPPPQEDAPASLSRRQPSLLRATACREGTRHHVSPRCRLTQCSELLFHFGSCFCQGVTSPRSSLPPPSSPFPGSC